MAPPGIIVVLNGAPRSGKSSIARTMQASADGVWLHLGVDAFCASITPARLLPGIGLRPGGERPDLEEYVPVLFDALYGSAVALSRLGLHVVVDVGHHDDYSRPLGILGHVARQALRPSGVLHRCALPGGDDHEPAGCRRARPRGPVRPERPGRGDPRCGAPLGARRPRPRGVRPRGRHLGPVARGVCGGDPGPPGPGTSDGLPGSGWTGDRDVRPGCSRRVRSTTATVTNDASDRTIMSNFAQDVSGMVSVGLNAGRVGERGVQVVEEVRGPTGGGRPAPPCGVCPPARARVCRRSRTGHHRSCASTNGSAWRGLRRGRR